MDNTKKPQGTFAKLMSSSPIKEGKEQDSGKPENQKTGNQVIVETRKPENLKAIKYSTQLHKDTLMRLKQYALVNERKDFEVLEDAVKEYLDKRESGNTENQKTRIPVINISGNTENPQFSS
jgi:hypothetical protein